MKHYLLSIISVIFLNYVVSMNELIAKKNKFNKPAKKKSFDLPEMDVYWRGWAKYYHYDNHTNYAKPPSLFQNNAYFAQRIPIGDVQQKDKYGLLNIPSKATFFIVLYNNTIGVYENRNQDKITTKLIDSLRLDYIEAVPEDAMMKGGIQDGGNFKFGSCINVIVNTPSSSQKDARTLPSTWIFCPETQAEKTQLINFMVRLKIGQQRILNKGVRITTVGIKEDKKKPGLGAMVAKDKRGEGVINSAADGYWIKLHGWTDCSLKCGNGTSYEQWMCVPPKGTGAPCKGDAIKTKPCNTFKCPTVEKFMGLLDKKLDKDGKTKKPEVSPMPQVRSGTFSNRPQRYSKCLVKDNDIFYVDTPINPTEAEKNREPIRKPARIIMNNKTISIFKDDTYEDLLYTFNLDGTTFKSDDEKCCFNLNDNLKTQKICGYKSNCGPSTENVWADQWLADFKLFKVECKVGRNKINMPRVISPEVEKLINEGVNGAVDGMDQEAAIENEIEVKKEVNKNSKRKYDKKKKEATNNELTVLSKEIGLENMVKQEEKKKEAILEQSIDTKITMETKKSECLEQNFQEKELDDEFESTKNDALNEIEETKQDAQRKINDNRLKLRRNIMDMKKKSKARSNGKMQQLSKIRSKMAKEIILANKHGDQEICAKGFSDEATRTTYCDSQMVDDWMSNSDCKSAEEFCPTCCEHEFGSMYIKARDKCYDLCDKLLNPKKPKEDKNLNTDRDMANNLRDQLLKMKPDTGAKIDDQTGGRWEYRPVLKMDNENPAS